LGSESSYLPLRLNCCEGTDCSSEKEDSKGDFLEKKNIEHIIGIHPGSGSRKKCWPMICFKGLIKKMALNGKIGFILFFGPAEEEWRKAYLVDLINENIIFVLNKPLKEVVKYLRFCHIYIGNDSGITHLASSLGIPTIAIFGPTDPEIWRPLGSNVRIVSADIDCAPCTSDVFQRCNHQRCLESINIKDVADAVDKINVW